MSGIKALKIGDLVLQRPVIQGGMGVGISLHTGGSCSSFRRHGTDLHSTDRFQGT